MKKTLAIILAIFVGYTSQAQVTKKVFVRFETQTYAAQQYVSGKNEWKPEVPVKDYLRIVIAPFEVPTNLSSNVLNIAISNQLAEFIYKNHLDKFKKFKYHTMEFNYMVLDYTPRDYDLLINDCKDCNYQHQKTLIDGFEFTSPKEEEYYKNSEYVKKMKFFLTGKE